MRVAKRVENLPPYLFAELDKRVAAKRAEGADVISLGIGDPDLPTPAHVVEAMREAVLDTSTHQYPSYYGMPELRRAIADYYDRRFGVTLDPDTEVLPLIGSKEGIAHIAVAFVDPGDRALVADPGYPVYGIGTILAGGEPLPLPLTAANRFLPDYDKVTVPPDTTIMWIGYPSNPTAAVAEADTLERTVDFARRNDLLVCHDAAYVEITFETMRSPIWISREPPASLSNVRRSMFVMRFPKRSTRRTRPWMRSPSSSGNGTSTRWIAPAGRPSAASSTPFASHAAAGAKRSRPSNVRLTVGRAYRRSVSSTTRLGGCSSNTAVSTPLSGATNL